MWVVYFPSLIFKASMADYFLPLRSVEVQAVRDTRDQNHYRICLATSEAGLPDTADDDNSVVRVFIMLPLNRTLVNRLNPPPKCS